MINVFQPSLSTEESQAASQVMASNWIGKGPKVKEFETAWAAHIGVNPENVVSITSATEGLFQAVELLDIGPGDEVIIPSIHFIGAANAVMARGARPVFCDVDENLNIDKLSVYHKITDKTKGIIVLHYGGRPCDIYNLENFIWSKRGHTIPIIEDSACSPASLINERHCGTLGDVGLWSFDAMKIMSTGDGGMVYCRDPQLAAKLRQSIYLGQDSQSGLSSDNPRWWEFGVTMPGRRAIMNDITAAIGLEQLKKLPGFVARRQQIWQRYNEQLARLDWLTLPPAIPDYVQSSYYFYWVQLERRDELAAYLKDKGIYTTFRYYPLHRVFKTRQSLPGADKAADTTLLLPLHQGLSDNEVDYVCEMVREFK